MQNDDPANDDAAENSISIAREVDLALPRNSNISGRLIGFNEDKLVGPLVGALLGLADGCVDGDPEGVLEGWLVG